MTSIQNAITTKKENAVQNTEKKTVNQLMSAILDGEKMRSRFDELLGKRAPQFISSLVSMVNASPTMQQAFYEAPMTVIQSALKAARKDNTRVSSCTLQRASGNAVANLRECARSASVHFIDAGTPVAISNIF